MTEVVSSWFFLRSFECRLPRDKTLRLKSCITTYVNHLPAGSGSFWFIFRSSWILIHSFLLVNMLVEVPQLFCSICFQFIQNNDIEKWPWILSHDALKYGYNIHNYNSCSLNINSQHSDNGWYLVMYTIIVPSVSGFTCSVTIFCSWSVQATFWLCLPTGLASDSELSTSCCREMYLFWRVANTVDSSVCEGRTRSNKWVC